MERKEIARTAFEAMIRADWDEALSWLDPEVEWRNPDYAVETGIRRGHAEFRKAAEAVAGDTGGAFEFTGVEVEDYVEIGDSVVMSFTVHGRGSVSGVPIDRQFGGLFRFRGDMITSFGWFNEPEEAFAAAQREDG